MSDPEDWILPYIGTLLTLLTGDYENGGNSIHYHCRIHVVVLLNHCTFLSSHIVDNWACYSKCHLYYINVVSR